MKRRSGQTPPGVAKAYARRSEEKAIIEEMSRHSGLDPE
jgi:hypothetical protein